MTFSLRCIVMSSSLFIAATVNSQEGINENPGHDFARIELAKATRASDEIVVNKFKELKTIIRASQHPAGLEHNAQTADKLNVEHQHWLLYAESHCWLVSSVYVYPSGSKMSLSEFNSCKLEMNQQRLNFMHVIGTEYSQVSP